MYVLHQICLNQVSQGPFAEILRAVVCGENISIPDYRTPLQNAGIIHLFVVSGGHLIFLMEWIERGSRALKVCVPWGVTFAVLTLYGGVANFQPPIARALIFMVLARVGSQALLNWPEWILHAVAGILSYALLVSDSTGELSLILSWQASIALSLLAKGGPFTQAGGVYLAVVPALLWINVPTPLSILINVLLVPVFSWVLLPVSVGALISPWIRYQLIPPVFDWLFQLLNALSPLLSPIGHIAGGWSRWLVGLGLLFSHAMLWHAGRDKQ